MQRYFLIMAFMMLVASSCKITSSGYSQKDDPFISNLIAQMTLEEKIGQMSQVNGFGFIPVEFKNAIEAGKIGSVLNEVNLNTRNEMQRIAVEDSRLGIPIIFARDVIHGFKTIFPIPLGQAATWNPDLVREGCRISAEEAWASGINWTFAPMMDITRDPRWGRIAESFGEDPYLASIFARAMVEGFQGDDLSADGSIVACAKHFAGYGATEGGRDYNTTSITEGDLRDIYLKPFIAAKDAGVGTFMSGFNELNGVPATGNEFLLRQVLRDEWAFDGFVVSDWASIFEMVNHGVVEDEKHAAQKAIQAGVDMEMATTLYHENLKDLIDEGKLTENLLDKSVYRILKIKKDLGLFNKPYIEEQSGKVFGKDEYLKEAQKAAVQSIVLLKNENNLLPFSDKQKKIAVIGPLAHQKYEQLGTWVFDADTTLSITPLEGMEASFGKENIYFAPGLDYSRDRSKKGFELALKQAKKSDVVLLCLGEESIISGEAHCLADLNLVGAQEELVKAIAETGKPLVMLIMAGRPLSIGEISEHADALLYAFHPGTMTGPALTDLITGSEVPSAKLPVTFPKSAGQIPFYYNHKNTGRPSNSNEWRPLYDIKVKTPQTSLGNSSHYLDDGFEPLYPFGYGLSYTTFEYKNLKIGKPEIKIGSDLVVTVELENTGEYEATEISQLYVRDLVAEVSRPIRELKSFKRTTLKPGESKMLTFSINSSEFAYHNQKGEKKIDPGKFDLWVGGSSKATLKKEFILY